MSSEGSTAIARAMPTRARCPPDKLMRIAMQKLGRQTDQLGGAPNARFDVRGVAEAEQALQRIGNRTEDAEGRIEAFGRILEYDLDTSAVGAADEARLRYHR